MMKARIVSKPRTGSVQSFIEFEMVDFHPISEERAVEAQRALGYHVMGYGFENFKVSRDPVLLRYRATWTCQGSCE